MKQILILALLALPLTLKAQVPTGATPITLKQVNTIAGVTTWTFTDSSGTYYLQSNAYMTIATPEGPSSILDLAPPMLWLAASTTPPPPTNTPSLDKTVITDNSGTIVDASGGKWTIVNGVVMLNGAAIGYSSGVAKLEIDAGVLWQQNMAGGWWYWNPTAVTWDGGAGPP